ncbi:MAG: hypothetical protein H6R10_3541 [Rhodocyclaceae bacterium]|nr:hypothetical protein [Rhodocyclaceae bacterium]
MARKYSVKQEQLTFPELLLSPVQAAPPKLSDAGAFAVPSEPEPADFPVAGDLKTQPSDGGLAGSGPRKSTRKRAARSKALSVPEATDGSEAVSVTPAAPEETRGIKQEPDGRPGAGEAPGPVTAPAGSIRFGETRPRLLAHIATIVSSAVAVVVLIFGSYQFHETQKAQRESIAVEKDVRQHERAEKAAETNARAVELFLKYNELMLQLNTPAFRAAKRESRLWKESLAVNLLESLFNLTRGNKDWEATIGWALEKHGRFIREQRLSCRAYSSEFVRYLETVFGAQARSLCRDFQDAG